LIHHFQSANVVLNASAPIANVNVAANAQLKNASPALIADANLLAIAKLDAHALLKVIRHFYLDSESITMNLIPFLYNIISGSKCCTDSKCDKCQCKCCCECSAKGN